MLHKRRVLLISRQLMLHNCHASWTRFHLIFLVVKQTLIYSDQKKRFVRVLHRIIVSDV
jgi:hypothetical protein